MFHVVALLLGVLVLDFSYLLAVHSTYLHSSARFGYREVVRYCFLVIVHLHSAVRNKIKGFVQTSSCLV